MNRKLSSIALVSFLLLATPTLAGSQTDPEVTDASGDVAVTGGDGPLNLVFPADEAFGDVDLVAAWIDEVDATQFAIHVETLEAFPADGTMAVSFTVNQGNNSVFASTAEGEQHDLTLASGSLAGPAVSSQDGNIVTFTIARADVGASGGDVIGDLVVSTSQTEEPTCDTGCNPTVGTDRAPDTGFGAAFTLSRPDVVAAGSLTFTGGNLTVNGTTTPFVGNAANTTFVNGTISLDGVLANTGTDVDTFSLTFLTEASLLAGGVNATFDFENTTLDPGASVAFVVNATFENATVGTKGFAFIVSSERGASSAGGATLVIEALPEPEPELPEEDPETPVNEEDDENVTADARDPILAIGPITTIAENTGFDDTFGDWAEVVLLALLLLLLIVLLFLILALAGNRWIKVSVSPKTITAAPGETAEFHVNVRNKKRRYHDALAYFDGDAHWQTGVLLEQDGRKKALTRAGAETGLTLGARDEVDDEFDGTLRVQIPHDALDKERDSVTLNVVPLGADGEPKHRKGGHAKVTVKAASDAPAPAAPLGKASMDVRLSDIHHDPANPAPETQVMTTATVENDSDTKTARLRVVLQLEGEDAEEQVIEVPPRSARAVRFPWIAEDGSNKVRVQIYEA